MATEEKPKPEPWRGHNLARYLTNVEHRLITKRKKVILTRVVNRDDFLEKLEKDYSKQSF